MKLSSIFYFAKFGLRTALFRKKEPILGTIILTDRCNLKCKHCSVNNINSEIYSYKQIKQEMKILYDMGIRILFFCGGETFLWEDSGKNLRDLVIEAKEMGFLVVNVVTNGTFPIDLPEADLILLSIDGDEIHHNLIRGDTYSLIMQNIENATSNNICFYMAINKLNKHTIRNVCEVAKSMENVRAVSFNFHTPYPDTKALFLSKDEKRICANTIKTLIDEGFPIFNLKNALSYIVEGNFPVPCYQCVVMEKGEIYTCGRCIEVPDLCNECGYFFVAEYTLAFNGNIKIILEMLKTYLKYV